MTAADRPTRVSAVVDDALGGDDLVGLLDRLARREVSADELRAAAVTRARSVNPHLNAVAAWVEQSTLPAAAADAPLAGIPSW